MKTKSLLRNVLKGIPMSLLCMSLCTTIGWAQITAHYENGDIATGKMDRRTGERTGWWKYDNGWGQHILDSYYAPKSNKLLKQIEYHYHPNGQLIETGLSEGTYLSKSGKWIVYDSTGKILRTEHYLDGRLHGRTRLFPEHCTVRNRYGLSGLDLFNSHGQRMVFLFTYGLGRFGDNSANIDRFACIEYPIAGCVVRPKIIRRALRHNFFVNLYQFTRFGFRWKKKFFDLASYRRGTPYTNDI